MSKKSIVIVFFGPISLQKEKLNLSSYNNEIVQRFHDSGLLLNIFCQDYHGLDVAGTVVHQFSGTLLSKIALTLSKVRFFIGWTERMIYERLFDLWVTWYMPFRETDRIVLLRATSPRLCRKAKRKKIKLIGLISTFPRDMIRRKISLYEEKWGFKEESDYTNMRRVKEFDLIVSYWDMIISLTASESVKERVEDYIHREKMTFPNHEFGINKDLFNPQEKTFDDSCMIFMVTTERTLKKGLLEFLEAWLELTRDENFKAKLLVVGNLGRAIGRIVFDKFSHSSIEFVGYAKHLERYYHLADVYVCPSVIDMGPRTIKQAMACGKLILASTQCGASSFIEDKVSGLLFDVEKKGQIMDCVRWSMENRTKVYEMGSKAHQKSLEFDNDSFAADIFSLAIGAKTYPSHINE